MDMDYSGIEQKDNDLILTDIKCFELAQTLDCGQAFRWRECDEGYRGVVHGRSLTVGMEVGMENNNLILKDVSIDEFESLWCDYFDLRRSYQKLHKLYSVDKVNKNLADAVAFSPGLRLFKQDPWEMLITFILSQNSNIPRIKGMIDRLCECFGKGLGKSSSKGLGKGLGKAYAFPEPQSLAGLSAADLSEVKTGYRAGYIIDAAQRVSEKRLDLGKLNEMPTDQIRQSLMEVHGVGPKVADCVLLYGFGRIECYPMDVWMKKVMAAYYPKGFPKKIAATSGIAQQFLFHYARSGNL